MAAFSHHGKTNTSFYEPNLYDMMLGPNPRVGDIYAGHAKANGGPVLELGCGTGNVLIPIARMGIKITGIDSSQAMLDGLRRKLAVETSETRNMISLGLGNAESFALEIPVRQILLPNDLIAHLLDNEALRSALKCCHRHLQSDGELILDIARLDDPASLIIQCNGHFEILGRYCLAESFAVQVLEAKEYDFETCIVSSIVRYELFDSHGCLQKAQDRFISLRPRRLEEMNAELVSCGYRIANVCQEEIWPDQDSYLIRAIPMRTSEGHSWEA